MSVNPITLAKAIAYDVKKEYPGYNPNGRPYDIAGEDMDGYITNKDVEKYVIPTYAFGEQEHQRIYEAKMTNNMIKGKMPTEQEAAEALKAMVLANLGRRSSYSFDYSENEYKSINEPKNLEDSLSKNLDQIKAEDEAIEATMKLIKKPGIPLELIEKPDYIIINKKASNIL